MGITSTDTDTSAPRKPQCKWGSSCAVAAIVGLQLLSAAAFGMMSPILSILMTEYFARLNRDGAPIDCGANSHDEACTAGSRQAAWLSSIFSAVGCVFNLISSPMVGQASDVYGRKPFIVLSQVLRLGMPFSIMFFMQPGGSITPYFVLRLVDSGFGAAGVMSAAIADIVAPEDRAAAFGVLFASLSVGYCASAFIAPFFSREHILQITAGLFVTRVLWAIFLLPETLPIRTRLSKARSRPGKLVLHGQVLLLKPLIRCVREKGVIVIALVASTLGTCGCAATAYYPHKWVVYTMSISGCISDLSFPAISALKSINASEKEQGRLQGAIYGARSIFEALGPVVFAAMYANMRRESVWSQALPFVVASFIYFVGVGVALSLPVGKIPPPSKIVAVPAPLLSPTYGESPTAMYFETDDDDEDETEDDDAFDRLAFSSAKGLDDDHFLAEPLLGSSSATHVHDEV
ncbi:hypothetical protein PF005_g9533 [Phytophthora fragariae]|uniref:Major facilitator superfamily (MFS) profile domain-containing protein n=1 Tax=Phytophthora fragariae TaxID=53985 RepID=A0A6A3YAP7_9STRA|nr:hypothetical protein PF005_g9533 [Phytophthora fragariae]KAE9257781.1 hypothetical protein PF002_g697 [Phytophthora fragariae]